MPLDKITEYENKGNKVKKINKDLCLLKIFKNLKLKKLYMKKL